MGHVPEINGVDDDNDDDFTLANTALPGCSQRPSILHLYNNTHHRSIGMAPSEVNADNEDVVRDRLYPLKTKTYRWKYAV